MPDIKEKLVELIKQVESAYVHGDVRDCIADYLAYGDASDKIADYLIANGVTMPEWISVEERLPDGGTYVLVTTDGVVAHAYRHNDRFIAFTAAGVATVGGVTHWMPLPEPPKGE